MFLQQLKTQRQTIHTQYMKIQICSTNILEQQVSSPQQDPSPPPRCTRQARRTPGQALSVHLKLQILTIPWSLSISVCCLVFTFEITNLDNPLKSFYPSFLQYAWKEKEEIHQVNSKVHGQGLPVPYFKPLWYWKGHLSKILSKCSIIIIQIQIQVQELSPMSGDEKRRLFQAVVLPGFCLQQICLNW